MAIAGSKTSDKSWRRWVKDALATLTAGNTWKSPVFDAGDFTANSAMTWTVQESDVTTLTYQIRGNTMTVSWWLQNTSLGGSPSTSLYITIPEGRTSTRTVLSASAFLKVNGSQSMGYCYVAADDTIIVIVKEDQTTYPASTNSADVYGQITFEID